MELQKWNVLLLLCLFVTVGSSLSFARDKKDDKPSIKDEKSVKVEGRAYAGKKLVTGLKLVFVSYENGVKLEKLIKDLDKYHKDYKEEWSDYLYQKEKRDDKIRDAKKNYKSVRGGESETASLRDIVKSIRNKYDKKMHRYLSAANSEKASFVRDYKRLLLFLQSSKVKDDPDTIVSYAQTDGSGDFKAEAPAGIYYYLSSSGEQSVRESDKKFYLFGTVTFSDGDKNMIIRVEESTYDFDN